MDRLRLYCWGGRSMHDPLRVMHTLHEKGILERCVFECHNGYNEYISDEVVSFINTSFQDEYQYSYGDMSKYPALSAEIMEKMKPYESMAIQMGMRRYEMPIVEYEREKQRYFRELRFWNYILESENINACFFVNVPHNQGAYIVYALARIKGIPIRFPVSSGAFRGYAVYTDAIENLGKDIENLYLNSNEDFRNELMPMAREFFENHTLPYDELKKKFNVGSEPKRNSEKERQFRIHFSRWYGLKKFKRNPALKYAKGIMLDKKGDKRYKEITKRKNEIIGTQSEINSLVRFYKKHYLMKQSKYNKIAEVPVQGEKYIYFAMQFSPEATTLPLAGVFVDQYTSIQLLARCADAFGLKVYVKEHVYSPFRNHHIYDEIKNIPNVRLIKTTASTYDVIENSVALATQTGTCILEGVLRKKPVLVFGDGYIWKGLPGTFGIKNEEQGKQIIEKVLCADFDISLDEVERYLGAFSRVCKPYYGMHADTLEKMEVDIDMFEKIIAEMKDGI